MGVYSNTVANAYADKIKAVYEYLDEIRKVADRLTPVEDLTSFRTQIGGLYAQLDLLVEASNLIVTATPTGEAILTGSVPSVRALLGVGDLPPGLVTQSGLDAALDALLTGIQGQFSTIGGNVSNIDVILTGLEQYAVYQQSVLTGLQLDYQNMAAGLETQQTNSTLVLSRLTVQEQFATLVDQQLTSISQNLTSTTTGLSAANAVLSGHTASIQSAHNFISLQNTSINQLSSNLNDLNTGLNANSTALNLLETTVVGLGEDITAQSQQTVALRSAIGGSANMLSNADFDASASGWSIVVAEGDWANTVLTTNTFNMPEEVNCLEVLGTPAPLGQIVVESPAVLVQAGHYYTISGYPGVDNGQVTLSYKTFDVSGAVVGQGVCPPTTNNTNNANFAAYIRTHQKFQASGTAVKIRLYLTVTAFGDWLCQGALFRPMVEQSWVGQEGPSAWTPNAAGTTQALSDAVESLSTEVSLISANATAVTQLSSRMDVVESIAATAEDRINQMLSDSILSPSEKPQLIRELAVLLDERPGILAEAAASNVNTTQYNGALDALVAYLDTLTTPVKWDNLNDITYIT